MNLRPIFVAAFLIFLGRGPASSAQPVSVDVLAQSPAETSTELQAICLFRSSPANVLRGSLDEINGKLNGLLARLRATDLFRGDLGETLVIAPPAGTLAARRLLIIGLGDSESFTPQRMELVGEILYNEARRMGIAQPFFAPTILDGGVNRFTTGEVAEQVVGGLLRAAAIDKVLRDSHAAPGQQVMRVMFLAGAKNVSSTRAGIQRAMEQAAR
jgi:hypothetical protein